MGKLEISKGETLFISGAGPIGLIAGQWAVLFGAKRVYYTDIDKRKLEFAKALGFYEYESGIAADCALEGTGYSDALQKCLEAVKNTYWHILRKELCINGTWNSSYNDTVNDWRESIKAMSDGRLNVKALITHKFPLSECNAAFEMMKNKTEFYNKVILNMN